MSFSSEIKNEIIMHQYKNACCRRALLNGVLFARGTLDDESVTLGLSEDGAVQFVSKLIVEFFSKTPISLKSPSGGRQKLISFSSPAASKYLRSVAENGSELYFNKCQYCKSAFLKGVFLAIGRVSDPIKEYRLEFSLVKRAEAILSMFESLGFSFNKITRKNEELLYTKKSSVIEDFFAAAQMNNTAFALMNEKIENEIRNNVNRLRNCETNNIGKSVMSSSRQLMAIHELEKANLLSTLPDELEKTARLRIKYEDYSLVRLAAISVPPITKSGLSHRLNKIIEIASERLNKKF